MHHMAMNASRIISARLTKAGALSRRLFSQAWSWAKRHKVSAALVVLAALYVGHWSYEKAFAASAPAQYLLDTVSRGTLVSSISGTGQVESSSQVVVKPKVSGQITEVVATVGQEVKQGDVLFRIDARDAAKALRDAQSNLTSAELSLSKFENGVTASSDRRTLDLEIMAKLPTIYSDIFPVMKGAEDILLEKGLSSDSGENNIHYYVAVADFYDTSIRGSADRIESALASAKSLYASAYAEYQALTPGSSPEDVEKAARDAAAFLTQEAAALKAAADVVKLFNDKMTLDNWHPDDPATVASHLVTLTGYSTTANEALATVESLNAELDSLRRSDTGTDLDERSQALTLEQRQNALLDAQIALSDYTVRAPFDGIVAAVAATKGDQASGASVTLISPDKIVTISLNEIDVAKVRAGEEATLTLDAVPGATFTGTVSSVDVLGTASQGVVNYGVKIALAESDSRVKPGMSVSAAIVTDAKADVLMVPTSAVKSDARGAYVEVIPGATGRSAAASASAVPQRVPVEIGASNETDTEIVSGLNEGDRIITRTVTATKAGAASTPSLFGGGGGRPSGGNATFRAGGTLRGG
jgi:RND family efflux transporter MFP subunit